MCLKLGLYFITGGVRSGKSQYAEQLVATLVSLNERAAYVATMLVGDEEMEERVQKHKADRALRSVAWSVYESPFELPVVTERVVLFECLTTWLMNAMFLQEHVDVAQTVAHFQQWVQTMEQQQVVIVSNELLDDGLSSYEETNDYLRVLAELHRWLVEHSDAAYEMTFSYVKKWK